MTNSAQSGLQFSEILKSSDQFSNLQADIGLVSVDDLLQEIGIHPYAAAYPAELPEDVQQQLLAKTDNNPAEFFVSALAAKLISAAQKAGEKPLKVRLAGADSHQRLALLGSELETQEVNPLIGKRGVSRWADKAFRKAFELECEAIKRARIAEGMANIELVIPFVRTFSESATAIDLLAEQGLCRGANGLRVHLLAELPANALMAEKFLQYFDGLVVDIDQLAQFALGLDQTHPSLEYLHDDQNEAVLALIDHALKAASSTNKPCDVVSHYINKAPNLQLWLLEHNVSKVITQ
ncbi:phosphoenolpyruvate-utilizing protein [Photobacterium rosenbergii]|uniref:Phosphoenolpyruvate-utilizing protein n=1 Tax=Photobacterium rosenbergii TaxID=294936 RepID=A0A2T3NFW9_9GAMM|nr:putative PEP-binding protein [Photobacterium rosenbergii]PSW13459.1 phosphoenolpyruvate-utilizing protein [Photobacterium rosenbergii]